MASTYSTNLAIELIGTGDQAGSWGNTTNTNLGTLIEQAISGYVTQAVSTGTDTTITIPNGATGVARNMYIELTGTGGASTNLIVPANKKLYFIFNNTSSGQVTVKVSGQTGVSVPNKAKMILVSNGTDIVDATNYIGNISAASANITVLTSASATITNLIATSASITTLTNNPTFSAGTANGVLYLNGSKVATSGSALTFDGTIFRSTQLNIGTAPNANSRPWALNGFGYISGASGNGIEMFNSSTSTYGYWTFESDNRFSFNAIGGHSWTAGGAEKMRVTGTVFSTDSSISVGIGTASPTSKLDLVGIMQWQATAGTVLGKLTYSGGEPVVLANTGLGLQFFTNNAFAAKIDTSFILGIGTASPASKLDTAGTIRATNQTVPSSGTGAELFYDATNAGLRGYNRTGSAYVNLALNDNVYIGGGSSGNVGIGTTSPTQKLEVVGGIASTGTDAFFAQRALVPSGVDIGAPALSWRFYTTGTTYTTGAMIQGLSAAAWSSTSAPMNMVFYTVPSGSTTLVDRGRFTADGNFLVGKAVSNDTTVGFGIGAFGTCASTNSDSTNSTVTYAVYSTGSSAYRFYVGLGGTVYATNTTISAISDQRYKENIRDLDIGLDAVMALKPRKFDWKEGKGKDIKNDRGFIAQEFEQVFPDLIDEWKDPAPEGEESYKSVRQDLIPVLVKAMQEQQAMIEALKAKVAALEAQ